MARGNFGERLKRERELREVSMNELSKATRISNRFLEALENEDWEKLPGGIFGHGFVRTVARYLGLDENALLGEYDLARADNLPPPPPKPEERIPSPPKWIPFAVLGAVLLLAVGLILTTRYAWHRIAAHRRASKQPTVSVSTSTGPSQPQTNSPSQPQASAPNQPGVSASISTSPLQPQTSASKQPRVSASIPTSASPPQTKPVVSPPAASSEIPPNAPLELTLSTSAATRVRVLADGWLLIDRHLPAGETRRFKAKQHFDVSVSDSSAVLLELNGKTMAPLGPPGASGRMVYSHEDLRKGSGGNSQP